MKLKENQLNIIEHLVQFGTLDYSSCLRLLDTENSCDRVSLSYAFRPLTKNKYIVKHNESVNILAKGRALFPNVKPLVSIGGSSGGTARINSVSRIAALMRGEGFEVVDNPSLTEYESFIPSACFRKLRTNILSTARFAGMLFLGDHRLAVYDIADGNVEWQMRAERSLYYINFFEDFDTNATAMLLICNDDKRMDIVKRIIRETMRRRKQLIEYESQYQRVRPIKYSKSPIRLASYYKRVYLTTPVLLGKSLENIRNENLIVSKLQGDREDCRDKKQGDFEEYPYRYFINPATDLLKYIYLFTELKSLSGNLKYGIALPKKDLPILEMYPEVTRRGGLKIYEF